MLKMKHRENKAEDNSKGQSMKENTGELNMEFSFQPNVENPDELDVKKPLDELTEGESATQSDIRGDSEMETFATYIKQLICETCKKTFSNKSNLTKHIKLKLCLKTSEKIVKPKNFTKHTRTHKKQFQCEHCKRKFETLLRLQKHCRWKHAQCEVCSGVFETGQELRKHQKESHQEKNFECSMCVYKFFKEKELDSHFLTVHTDLKKEECKECGGMFNNLKRHFIRRHTDRDRKICNVCGGVFKAMRQHLLRSSCRPGEKVEANFQCDLCSKTFTLKQGLTRHIKVIHEQVKDYACEACDYKATSKYNMELHQGSMHNGMRPKKQQCPHCDKTPYKLDWHILTYHSLANHIESVSKPTCE